MVSIDAIQFSFLKCLLFCKRPSEGGVKKRLGSSVWPDVAKFSHFGDNLAIFEVVNLCTKFKIEVEQQPLGLDKKWYLA